jgi:hypothetical protein
MIKIQDHYVPADFMILDMGEKEEDVSIILGRPFLNTTNAIIYIGSGQIHFQFLGQKVRCYFNSYITYEQSKKTRSKRRHRSSQYQRNQLLKNEKGEVEKDEQTTPKSSPQPKQVWKKKVTSSSESSSQEVQPSRSLFPGLIDATEEYTGLLQSYSEDSKH